MLAAFRGAVERAVDGVAPLPGSHACHSPVDDDLLPRHERSEGSRQPWTCFGARQGYLAGWLLAAAGGAGAAGVDEAGDTYVGSKIPPGTGIRSPLAYIHCRYVMS